MLDMVPFTSFRVTFLFALTSYRLSAFRAAISRITST
jgi:hypothetical protein